MALKVNNFTGFEPQGAQESSDISGSPAYPTTDPISGLASLRFTASGSWKLPWVSPGITDAGNDYVVGVAVNFADKVPSSAAPFIQILDDAGPILDLRLETNSNVLIRDANQGTIRTLIDPFTVDQEHYIEIYFQHQASATMEVFVDGISQGEDTLEDLTDGGTLTDLGLFGINDVTVDFDDVYILSGATAATDRLGGSTLESMPEVFGYQTGHSTNQDIGDALASGQWNDTGDTPAVEEGDAFCASLDGASSTTADTDMDDINTRGLGPGPESLKGDKYYFDTSDAGPRDDEAVWTNAANYFDGSTSTFARTTTGSGGENLNELRGEGTNAPASGGTILRVFWRLFSKSDSSDFSRSKIYTDGEGEELSERQLLAPATAAWSTWGEMNAPSGGWTWAKLQALEINTWPLSPAPIGLDLYRVEIFVEHTTGTEKRDGPDVSGTIKAAKFIFNLKRTNGSGTSMGYRFGNDGDGVTSSGNIEGSLSTAYTTIEELSEAAGVVPTATEDFRIGLEAGTTDTGGRDIFCSEAWAMLLHVPDVVGGHTITGDQTLSNYSQAGTVTMHPDIVGAQVLAELAQQATVNEIFTVAVANLLAEYLQSAQSHMNPDIAGAQILADYLQTGSPVQIFSATGVQALANYLQSGTATSIEEFTATGAQSLFNYLQSGVGAHPHSVSGVQTLVDFLQSGSAVQIFLATGAQSLSDFLQSGDGIMLPSGAGDLTLAELQQAGVAVQVFLPVGDQTLADYLQSGDVTSTLDHTVSGAQILVELQQAGVAVQIFTPTGDQTLEDYLQSGDVVMHPSVAGVQTLEDFLQSGTVEEIFLVSGALTLAELQQAGVAVMIPAGTGVQSLANFLQAATFNEIFTVSGVQTLDDYLQSAVGLMHPDGTGVLILSDYLQSGNLTHTQESVTGDAAQVLANFLQAGSAHMVPTFTGDMTLANFEQAGGVALIFTMSGVMTLDDYLQSGMINEIFSVAGALTLAELQQAGVILMLPSSAGAQTLADLLQAGSIVETLPAAGVQSLENYLQNAAVVMLPSGTGGLVLADYEQEGSVIHAIAGHTAIGDQTLEDYLQAATGVMLPSMSGSQILFDFLQAGSALVIQSAAGDQILAQVTMAGSGKEIFVVAGAQTLAGFAQSGDVVMLPSGVGANILAEYLQSGSGSEIIIGTGIQSLPDILQAGVAVMSPSAAGNQVLEQLAQNGVGIEIFIATGGHTLPNFTQSGGVELSFSAVGAQALADFVQAGTGNHVFIATIAGAQMLADYAQLGTGLVVLAPPLFVAKFIKLLGAAKVELLGSDDIAFRTAADIILRRRQRGA